MKKITFIITFLFTSYGFAQNVSSGVVTLTTGFTVQFDVNGTTNKVTMTMVGPDDKWLAVGLNVNSGNSMGSSGDDVIIYHGNPGTLSDRNFTGSQNTPNVDSSQDWALDSNTTASGVRTIVATRDLNTGDSNDYTFSASAGSLTVIYAVGSSTTYAYHGGNRGASALSVTLGVSENNLLNFEMYPNPVSDLLNIQLPTGTEKAEVDVFDYTGRLVSSKTISFNDTAIDVQKISKGIYMIRVATNTKIGVQRFIKK